MIERGFVKHDLLSFVDIVDPCLGNSCQNGATCAREGLTGTKCICAPGYGGALCDITLPSKMKSRD